MRKFVVLTLGLLLAAASATATAGGYYDRGWRDHRYDHRWDRRDRHHRDAYLVGGVLLGLAAGAALSDNDRGWRRGDYYYDGRHDRGYYGGYYDDRRYGSGYYGGGYYGGRPYYGRDVVVYRDRPRWGGRRHYGPPRRVVHHHHYYRDRRW